MSGKELADLLRGASMRMTCSACPSQWEGWTDEPDERAVYVRYRHGHLSVGLGFDDGAAVDNSAGWDGEPAFSRQLTDKDAGVISWVAVLAAVEAASESPPKTPNSKGPQAAPEGAVR